MDKRTLENLKYKVENALTELADKSTLNSSDLETAKRLLCVLEQISRVTDGIVWVYFGDMLYASAIGDEEGWISDPADSSTAQWVTVGYKDGGEIVGVVSLSSDVLIIKDNGHVFRLSGSYPDWTVKEVSREVTCRGYRASVGIINNAVILGNSFMQAVSTTQEYGDMKATDISAKVKNEIAALPKKVKLRYVAPYNQIWLVDGDRRFLFLELDNNAYFEREYTTALMDVCYKENEVFVLKKDKIQILDPDSEFDEDDFLKWRWRAKTLNPVTSDYNGSHSLKSE